MEINGKLGNLTPCSPPNLWSDGRKIWHGWCWGHLPLCKISLQSDKGFLLPAPASPPSRQRVQSDSASFFWFCRHRTEKPPALILQSVRQMMSFRIRMCLLGVLKQKFTFWPHFTPKTQIFGQFRIKKAITMGMLACKLPLIIIVAPW